MEATNVRLGVTTWLQRARFVLSGFLVCLFRGRLDRFDYLVGQARFESADYTSRNFWDDQCPWGMRPGSLSSRRTSERALESGGYRAVYRSRFLPGKGWGDAFGKAWQDRLDWDDAHNPAADTSTLSSYMDAVFAPVGANAWGWLGYGTSAGSIAQYKAGWSSSYGRVSGIAKSISGVARGGLGKILLWIFVPLVLLALVWLGIKIWRRWKRK